jgi:hypothetical protein
VLKGKQGEEQVCNVSFSIEGHFIKSEKIKKNL